MKDIKKMSIAELQAEARNLEKKRSELRAKAKKLREQLAFDALPKKEQLRRRAAGLDPYEPEEVRAKKRAEAREAWKKDFDTLPIEARKKLTALGVSPYQNKEKIIIRRETGTMRTI